MEPSTPALPPSLPGRLCAFLDAHFKVPGDLSAAPSLLVDLEENCREVDGDVTFLADRLDVAVRKWTAPLEESQSMLSGEMSRLREWKRLCSSTNLGGGSDEGKTDLTRIGTVLGVELPLLAKEVHRIETARLYAETSLCLEALVGDLEDAVLSHMGQNPKRIISMGLLNASSSTDFRYKQEKLLTAVKAMREIEEVLVTIVKKRRQYSCLIAAVDSRVEKIFAILRPQVLRDYRVILSSLGWPPPLLSNSEKEPAKLPNPLLVMPADKKEIFTQSFLALCSLQHLQAPRQIRQHSKMLQDGVTQDVEKSSDMVCLDHNLWTIDELVFSLESRMEHHFSMWSEEPKFIFALVYKVTCDFLEGIEDVLQPLIDKAKLVGSSAKEAWVLAMVKMLSAYLTGRVFTALVKKYDVSSENTDVISSWLRLIDLMISFDKRMISIASSGAVLKGLPSNIIGDAPTLLFLTFRNHHDWLQMWAEIELRDAEERLTSELEDEIVWTIDIIKETESINNTEGQIFLPSCREDYKAPRFADSVIKIARAMIERCKMLSSLSMRLQFIRSSARVLLNWFYQVLLQRCQVMDPTATIMGDEVLLRVTGSVNAARYCEFVMQEWGEDISLVELSILAKNGTMNHKNEINPTFFQDEINNMANFETDRLVDIMSSLLLEFEYFSMDYVQNKMHWEETNADGHEVDEDPDIEQMSVSKAFIESLDMLSERLESLKSLLNFKDFADCWRSSASGIDHFIFNSIVMNNTKFSSYGVRQFKVDVSALFLVFKSFCVRPQAFFPHLSDSLKLLAMPWEDSKWLLIRHQSQDDIRDFLHLRGVCHISLSEAQTIASNMIFADQAKTISRQL